jgi:hypothetical protein
MHLNKMMYLVGYQLVEQQHYWFSVSWFLWPIKGKKTRWKYHLLGYSLRASPVSFELLVYNMMQKKISAGYCEMKPHYDSNKINKTKHPGYKNNHSQCPFYHVEVLPRNSVNHP